MTGRKSGRRNGNSKFGITDTSSLSVYIFGFNIYLSILHILSLHRFFTNPVKVIKHNLMRICSIKKDVFSGYVNFIKTVFFKKDLTSI